MTGGLDIAAEAAGFTTVGQCEWAEYPTKVLEKHWPDVPRWKDIRTLTGSDFYARTGLRTVDIISGGFPCQPFSVAGKRRGKEDDRYLWPEMCRVISEIRPTWVIGENVPGIVNLALDEVLSDLESQGYSCQTFIIPAAGVDAPHRRERICLVAYSDGLRLQKHELLKTDLFMRPSEDVADTESRECKEPMCSWGRRSGLADSREIMADTQSPGLPERQRTREPGQPGLECGCEDVPNAYDRRRALRRYRKLSTAPEAESGWRDNRGRTPKYVSGQWWPAEPDVGRGFDGLSAILDGIGGLSDAAKNRACEALCDVRESFTPEAVQRAFGGFQGISAEEILLAFLCEYEESCFRSGTSETSGTVPEGLLRGLWRTVESARASYRREYHSQLAREYSDALLRLSHGAPSLMPQAWANGTWEDGIERVTHGIKFRVDRLKCLGNAVVPAQFYPFFKYIAEIEITDMNGGTEDEKADL